MKAWVSMAICTGLFWPSLALASTQIDLGSITTKTRVVAVEDGSDLNPRILNKTREIDYLFDTTTSRSGIAISKAIGGSTGPSEVGDALSGLRVPIGSRVPPYAAASAFSDKPDLDPTSDSFGTGRAFADTIVSYLFRINGPENIYVPVKSIFSLQAKTDGDTQLLPFLGSYQSSGAEIHISNLLQDVFSKRVECNGAACDDSFVGSTSLNLLTNSLYSVRLETFARTESYVVSQQGSSILANSASTASSFADPYFFIDDELFDASQYSIVFSTGVNNVSPFVSGVPESNTWAMMVLGFGMVGAAIRRSSKLACVAA